MLGGRATVRRLRRLRWATGRRFCEQCYGTVTLSKWTNKSRNSVNLVTNGTGWRSSSVVVCRIALFKE